MENQLPIEEVRDLVRRAEDADARLVAEVRALAERVEADTRNGTEQWNTMMGWRLELTRRVAELEKRHESPFEHVPPELREDG